MAEIRPNAVSSNDRIRVQEARSCLLCGKEGVFLYGDLRDCLFGAAGTWALMRCPTCHFIWLNPRPVPADIGNLYEQYFTHDTVKHVSCLSNVRKIIENAVLASSLCYSGAAGSRAQRGLGNVFTWIGPIREVVEFSVMTLYGPPKGKLLDVGCGSGQFLAKMRDLGWEVVGVEPDESAANVARRQFGLSIYEGTLEQARFPNDTFEAITMNHVVEHLWDPIGTLQECGRVLKPGGKLVVVTPNVGSLGHRLFGKAWRGLEVPRHLYLFSTRSLRACAERTVLRLLELRTTARAACWMMAASSLIRRNGGLPGGSPQKGGLWLHLAGLVFQAVEHVLCQATDMGEEVVLVATK